MLCAENPIEALEISRTYGSKIHLVLTDIILPHMNGKDLAAILIKEMPMIQVIFMSGYTENVMVELDILDEGHEFLEKPFLHTDLLIKVKNLLSPPKKKKLRF